MESSVSEDPAQQEQRESGHCSLREDGHCVEVVRVHAQVAVRVEERNTEGTDDTTTMKENRVFSPY